ncbi:MAG: hypothetical protein RM338_24665 [Nostoc sp. DedQUE12a]|nr:hypothetical protein [Nostoc sp. DedQUE12a]
MYFLVFFERFSLYFHSDRFLLYPAALLYPLPFPVLPLLANRHSFFQDDSLVVRASTLVLCNLNGH